MGCDSMYQFRDYGPYYRAWENHYMAKGASKRKAESLAFKKVQKRKFWPPEHKGR